MLADGPFLASLANLSLAVELAAAAKPSEAVPAGELAGRLSRSVDNGTALLALSPDEQLAILAVLEEAETPPVAELRGQLAENAGRRAGL